MNKKLETLIKVSVLAAIAAVVMLFEVSLVPLVPPFYKVDLSEVIVLLGGFALGPGPAIMIEALKNFINFLLDGTTTMGIGEVANFLMGCALVLPASYMYHKNKTKKQALLGMLVGIISLCVVAMILNYFVLLPAYAYFFKMPIEAFLSQASIPVSSLFTFMLVAVLPFNLIKGFLSCLVVFLLYKRVTPILKNNK
ncbi:MULTISPECIES: ECF transporter S component [unclassified Breznakia]|uniref:ECF transporter S component n=1 Tax=unclassified Breznakia TaxID=2623764 RepID=UPI002474DEC0|nr:MULTISPECIES: ECF transporter S component [unclassified Breznakia]MDH6366556.1 riboflavin transporter FmnP [Breznakia sp. PH1-1]MDH6403649.1 riboflavin transporter FmnP [Breznakia sp. PF1-11]MDH6411358.1 riboflavin transporter FmnP [Breznakia sp. PFB1-11]MDH6413666.1 riboflavin transporter FmnP [Breznakia sp. PFB1-14]MDH6415903.1 riboflavin transporter FmnP [Breznakia sp. PFB1-4]